MKYHLVFLLSALCACSLSANYITIKRVENLFDSTSHISIVDKQSGNVLDDFCFKKLCTTRTDITFHTDTEMLLINGVAETLMPEFDTVSLHIFYINAFFDHETLFSLW